MQGSTVPAQSSAPYLENLRSHLRSMRRSAATLIVQHAEGRAPSRCRAAQSPPSPALGTWRTCDLTCVSQIECLRDTMSHCTLTINSRLPPAQVHPRTQHADKGLHRQGSLSRLRAASLKAWQDKMVHVRTHVRRREGRMCWCHSRRGPRSVSMSWMLGTLWRLASASEHLTCRKDIA